MKPQQRYQAVLTKHIGESDETSYFTSPYKRQLIREVTSILYDCKYECDMAFVVVCDTARNFKELYNAKITNDNGEFVVRRTFLY